ncbi:hypothetical protein [Nostoc sp. FACHB-888]|uniref:hypothetical protein n=1 Tax=Nostoc sp. FACHB-888 TaxID=2692842 RepID=UPI001683C1F0|nr:hypothetical protein [Nostoc sp. FACHB-888]MBD2248667.1 hypothetical protein [Nostoc sp. FACHB-888]
MPELFSVLTKYPVFLGIIVGTISAFVGSLSALVTTIITIRSQRDREREQWVREKLQEIYSNCIGSLTILHANTSMNPQEFAEAVRWLNILLIYYSKKYNKGFLNLPEEVALFSSRDWSSLFKNYNNMGLDIKASFHGEYFAATEGLLNRIIKLASEDKRLHG